MRKLLSTMALICTAYFAGGAEPQAVAFQSDLPGDIKTWTTTANAALPSGREKTWDYTVLQSKGSEVLSVSKEISASSLNGRKIKVAMRTRGKDIQPDAAKQFSAAKCWLMLEYADGRKYYPTICLKTGDSGWTVGYSEAADCKDLKKAVLSIGMFYCAGTMDVDWIAICDAGQENSLSAAMARQEIDVRTREIAESKTRNPFAVLDTVDEFKPAIGSRLGLGGASITFEKRGEYFHPYMVQKNDPERGSVGEICFPQSGGNVDRELIFKIRPDDRIRQFSFLVKKVSGLNSVNLTIYSGVKKQHYRVTVPLTDKWERVSYHLSDFVCIQDKAEKLLPEYINNFQFNGDPAVQFLISDLVTESNCNLDNQSIFVTRPFNAPWTFDTAKPVSLSYFISSGTPGQKVQIKAVIKKNNGEILVKTADSETGTGLKTVPLNIGQLDKGYYQAEVSLFKDGRLQDKQSDAFIVCAMPDKQRAPTLIGVNIDNISQSASIFRSLSDAGIQTARLWNFTWDSLEIKPGVWDFSSLDCITGWAKTANLTILPILQAPPPWEIDPPLETKAPWHAYLLLHRPPVDLAHWSQYVSKIVGRYKDQIKYWEIWNEPDWQGPFCYYFWGSTEYYLQVLKASYEAAKQADPESRIISGGISRNQKYTVPDFTSKLIESGYSKYMDVYGFHSYISWAVAKKEIDIVRSYKADMPLWQTEVGAGGEPGTPAEVAKSMRKYMEHCFPFLENGVTHYSFFIISPSDGDLNLLHPNGSPNEKLAGICTAARVLTGAGGIKRHDLGSIKYYTFTAERGYGMAVFGPGKCSVRDNSAEVLMIDAMGAEKVLKGGGEIILNDQVLYLCSPKKIELE